ncbi:unnamed protein product, partial [Polarella glacialis]
NITPHKRLPPNCTAVQNITPKRSAAGDASVVGEAACQTRDPQRRVQLQGKLAHVCQKLCHQLMPGPDCTQCPAAVAGPGPMAWTPLLQKVDELTASTVGFLQFRMIEMQHLH